MSKKDDNKIENEIPVEELTETAAEAPEKKSKKKSGKKSKSSKELEELKTSNEELNQELSELKDKYVRLVAEFDNFRKRTRKERVDLIINAAEKTWVTVLPVLDDFDRAKQNAEADDNVEPLSEGVMLVYQKLYQTLEQQGVKAMESDGQDFNPDFHEAITEAPAPSEDLKGKVIATVEKGYLLNEKIIRYAKVVVGK